MTPIFFNRFSGTGHLTFHMASGFHQPVVKLTMCNGKSQSFTQILQLHHRRKWAMLIHFRHHFPALTRCPWPGAAGLNPPVPPRGILENGAERHHTHGHTFHGRKGENGGIRKNYKKTQVKNWSTCKTWNKNGELWRIFHGILYGVRKCHGKSWNKTCQVHASQNHGPNENCNVHSPIWGQTNTFVLIRLATWAAQRICGLPSVVFKR